MRFGERPEIGDELAEGRVARLGGRGGTRGAGWKASAAARASASSAAASRGSPDPALARGEQALALAGRRSPSSGLRARRHPPSRARRPFAFVDGLWPLAEARGVKRATFDAAFAGVTFDPRIVAHSDPGRIRPADLAILRRHAARIAHGRARAEDMRPWLAKAEQAYGVDAGALMGVWGMESEFGVFTGGDLVVRALASLAFVHYQGDYFRDELIAALAILEEGDVAPREMKGSWAGAMGETQFMPSSFLEYAVDFEGHGRRDIWDSAPDAIGSTANFLAKHGWIAGAPWGFEVRLPDGFKLTAAEFVAFRPFSALRGARGHARRRRRLAARTARPSC